MKMTTGLLAAIMSTAMLGLAGLAATAAPAGASSGTPTTLGPPANAASVVPVNLDCLALGVLPVSLTATSFQTAPGSVQAGMPVNLSAVRTVVQIPAEFVNLAIEAGGLTSLSGDITQLDFNATNATPATIDEASTEIPFGPIPLTLNQPAAITIPNTPAKVGTWTAGSSGTINFTPGDSTVVLDFGTSSIDITCMPATPAPSLGSTVIR